ncbi:hypothetical protein GGR52DRAFT_229843 [Hypoxylon sp. FL1284]|nr:hypothetical protein GGR52DRAFT_229843 [Hypoxylon sp. FL1284]
MTDERRDSGVSFAQFFDRCKLPARVKEDCDAFARSRYSAPVRPVPFQGYCSYTVFVGEDMLVQFRPLAHKLNLDITNAACRVFGSLAPETESLGELRGTGLYAFSMRRMPGVSLADLRAEVDGLRAQSQREAVVRDFARLQVMTWAHAKSKEAVVARGTVGASLHWRLDLMANKLPVRFRRIAKSILLDLSEIENLPWVLSHGDFLASNIMVHPKTGKLVGLIDWAEGEFLPFGVGMYGYQELLGEDRDGHYVYYPEAKYLRKLFWKELLSNLPDLAHDVRRVTLIQKAQILGILLWHGIAFDNGKLDRVVEDGIDDGEIERLDAFLLSSPGSRKLGPVYSLKASSIAFLRRVTFRKG